MAASSSSAAGPGAATGPAYAGTDYHLTPAEVKLTERQLEVFHCANRIQHRAGFLLYMKPGWVPVFEDDPTASEADRSLSFGSKYKMVHLPSVWNPTSSLTEIRQGHFFRGSAENDALFDRSLDRIFTEVKQDFDRIQALKEEGVATLPGMQKTDAIVMIMDIYNQSVSIEKKLLAKGAKACKDNVWNVEYHKEEEEVAGVRLQKFREMMTYMMPMTLFSEQSLDEESLDLLYRCNKQDLRDPEVLEAEEGYIKDQLAKDLQRCDYMINDFRFERKGDNAQKLIEILKDQVKGDALLKNKAANLFAWLMTQGTFALATNTLAPIAMERLGAPPQQDAEQLLFAIDFKDTDPNKQTVTVHVESTQWLYTSMSVMMQHALTKEEQKGMVKVLMEVDVEIDIEDGEINFESTRGGFSVSPKPPKALPTDITVLS